MAELRTVVQTQLIKKERKGGSVTPLRNAAWIPAFYFIPEDILQKCGADIYSIPRTIGELWKDEAAIATVESDLFNLVLSDAYAYMVWPFLCPEIPYMEIFSGDEPSWKLAHRPGIWVRALQECGYMPTIEELLASGEYDYEFNFMSWEAVSYLLSVAVPWAVQSNNLQPIIDTAKEFRCFEDFDYRESNQKIDFVRKWYHTRTKHPQISFEGYQEHCKQYYDDIEWEIPDPISSFEEEVEARVDVNKFLSKIKDKDKQILQMRAEGYTNQEIADRLGYKTHSAVVKRIKKLGKMYQDSSGLNFGF
jgi:hypothetical protein